MSFVLAWFIIGFGCCLIFLIECGKNIDYPPLSFPPFVLLVSAILSILAPVVLYTLLSLYLDKFTNREKYDDFMCALGKKFIWGDDEALHEHDKKWNKEKK